jgi:hypothetical protein
MTIHSKISPINENLFFCIKDENEKKLRALKKKLEQTKKLVDKQTNGEKLEPNQVCFKILSLFKKYIFIFVLFVSFKSSWTK